MGNGAQRIPSWPGALAPTKAEYICADQPPPLSFFACDKAADHTFRVVALKPGSLLRLYIRPALGAKLIGTIGQMDMQALYAEMFGRGLSESGERESTEEFKRHVHG